MTLPIWPFPPDWSNEFRVSYEFKTEVITSRSGKEQRRADRAVPRIDAEFSAIVMEYAFRSMLGLLAMNQNALLMMPDWSSATALSDQANAGATTVYLDDSPDWLSVGMDVAFIWGEPGEVMHEQAVIASIGTGSIVLTAALSKDVPADAYAYRTWQGTMSTETTSKMHGDRMSEVSVKFSVDPGFEKQPSAGSAPLTYQGRELFMLEPNWQNDISVDFATILNTVDYGHGRIGYERPVAFNSRKVQFTYLATERQSAFDFRNFFLRLYGQQGEFFMPTFTEDLRLRANTASGVNQLRVLGADIAANFAGSTVYGNIVIFYTDDTHDLHQVTSISTVTDSLGADSVLHISPNTTRAIKLDDVRMVCWLPLWRSITDQIALQWVTDEIANIGLSLKTIETLGAET